MTLYWVNQSGDPPGGTWRQHLQSPGEGMHITRRFTTAGQDPYTTVPFRTATSEIRNPDGSVVFQADGIEVSAE